MKVLQKTRHDLALYNNLLTILCIFIINLVIKSLYATGTALWYDETYSVFHAQQDFSHTIWLASQDQNPPFYNFVLMGWVRLFGISEFTVRFLSVFISSLTAAYLFSFAKKHFNRQTAIFVSVLFILSGNFLIYSHEVRSYSLTALLCIMSADFFLRMYEMHRKSLIIGLALVNAAIVYTHFTTVFFLVTEGIIALLFYIKNKAVLRDYVISQVLAFFLFLPWISKLISIAKVTQNENYWLKAPSFSEFAQVVSDLYTNSYFLFASILIIIAGTIYLVRKQTSQVWMKFFFLFLWTVFPLFAAYLGSKVVPMFGLRYILFTLLGGYLLVSYILSLIPLNAYIKYSTFILFGIYSFYTISLNPQKNQDFRTSMPLIKQLKGKDGLVILSSIDLIHTFSYYYDRSFFEDFRNTQYNLEHENVILMNDSSSLSKYDLNKFKDITLVQSFEQYADPNATIMQALNNRLKLTFRTTNYPGVTITAFKNEATHSHTVNTKFSASSNKLYVGAPEGYLNWYSIGSLTNELKRNVSPTSKITPENKYGITYMQDMDTSKVDEIKLSCWIYTKQDGGDVHLAISFEDKQHTKSEYSQYTVNTKIKELGQWKYLEYSCPCPKKSTGLTIFKAYVWNSGTTGCVYVDEMVVDQLKNE